ncbi:MAG: hypothetical protein SCH68_09935 [Brevefilum sp.]|nr:hypothetical protein [Brevefilum sp.]
MRAFGGEILKNVLFALVALLLLVSCSPSPSVVQTEVAEVVNAFTPYPTYTPFFTLTPYSTYTPYPTSTPEPTIAVTRVVVQSPTPNFSGDDCKPMAIMSYDNNTNAFAMLQAHVATLPDVRTVSYTINERLFSNSLSHIVFVRYVADQDGEVYSKRYIVYLDEFGWSEGVFSVDGQCWIDGPHD